jgi:predicted HTH transcriptional regulator
MSEQPTALNLAGLRSADSLPITDTSVDLLDLDKVRAHIARATESGRLGGPPDPLPYLLHKQCAVETADEIQVTLAGLLCFGRDPQRLIPRAVIDLGHYRGLDPLSYEVVHLEKEIGGTVFEQLARVETYIWTNMHHGMTLSDRSFQRIEVHEYPRAVVRELSVNMIAHRDYTNFRSSSRIQIFRNRIEWISPGGLPPGVTVENILEEQAARNPVIMSILYENGFVEAFGQGLNTTVAVLRQEAMEPPRFQDTGASFIVTVYGRPLDLFYGGGVYADLNESQRKILAVLRNRGDLTPREITAAFPDRARRSIQRDLAGLVDNGLIAPAGEGRALRYRVVYRSDLDDGEPGV